MEDRVLARLSRAAGGLELDPGVDDRPEYASDRGGAKASRRTPGCGREDLGLTDPVSALAGQERRPYDEPRPQREGGGKKLIDRVDRTADPTKLGGDAASEIHPAGTRTHAKPEASFPGSLLRSRHRLSRLGEQKAGPVGPRHVPLHLDGGQA